MIKQLCTLHLQQRKPVSLWELFLQRMYSTCVHLMSPQLREPTVLTQLLNIHLNRLNNKVWDRLSLTVAISETHQKWNRNWEPFRRSSFGSHCDNPYSRTLTQGVTSRDQLSSSHSFQMSTQRWRATEKSRVMLKERSHRIWKQLKFGHSSALCKWVGVIAGVIASQSRIQLPSVLYMSLLIS